MTNEPILDVTDEEEEAWKAMSSTPPQPTKAPAQ